MWCESGEIKTPQGFDNMKKAFPGFYSPTEDELRRAWKDENTLFVFDTNTLLNLYGYAKQTRDDFFSILEVIKERIWIPYHVGLEYQRRRLNVVKNEKAVFKDIDGLLGQIEKIFDNEFPKLGLGQRFPKLHENTTKLEEGIKKSLSNYRRSVKHWDDIQPCVRGHDEIRDKLNSFFENQIGPPPSNQEEIDQIVIEGALRYQNKTPPGYEDKDKDKELDSSAYEYAGISYERKYGDLIIWKQLLEKVSEDDDIKAVIFVTDDAKEDWWYIIDSRGKKTIGPRAELREEIAKKAGVEIFNIYNTSGFLEAGEELLEVNVKDESITDADRSFNASRYANYYQDIGGLFKIHNSTDIINSDLYKNTELFKNQELLDSINYSQKLSELLQTPSWLTEMQKYQIMFDKFGLSPEVTKNLESQSYFAEVLKQLRKKSQDKDDDLEPV